MYQFPTGCTLDICGVMMRHDLPNRSLWRYFIVRVCSPRDNTHNVVLFFSRRCVRVHDTEHVEPRPAERRRCRVAMTPVKYAKPSLMMVYRHPGLSSVL